MGSADQKVMGLIGQVCWLRARKEPASSVRRASLAQITPTFAIVLFGPLLFPVARALHIDDVHYSMVVILAMGLGLFAPPLGVGFYAARAISKVSPDGVSRRVWPYLLALLLAAFIPRRSTGFLLAAPHF
jgi:TRAP-type C4-dicarboxylate transport system permease large subunit